MFGQRLKQLRLARGMSLDALAAEMGGIVTKQALSKYEKEKARPSPVVLNRLASALGVKSAHLWSEPTIRVEFIAYRKGAGLLKREQETVESLVTQTLEDRIHLQELTNKFDGSKLPVRALCANTVEDAEHAAEALRIQWNLGTDPIASVTDVLEDNCIHVLEVDASEKFDGSAAVAHPVGEERVVAAAIVTRRGVPGGRQRLNLSHELGHLVLCVPQDVDEEKMAFRFGSAFLAPAQTVYREVGSSRSFIRSDELLLLKRRFGMSVQALLYRLRDLRIISDSHYTWWCKGINRMGWRKEEPFELAPEKSKWLLQNTLRALSEGLLTTDEAKSLLGKTMERQEPLSLIERRAFLKLPLEERRRILAEQAERMVSYYEQDSGREGLQAGDVIAY